MSNGSIEQQLADQVGNQLDEQRASEQQFAAKQKEQQDQVSKVTSQMMERLMDYGSHSSKQQWRPEVLEIAQTLQAQPLLVAPVQAYLRNLSITLQSAISKTLSEMTPEQIEDPTRPDPIAPTQ